MEDEAGKLSWGRAEGSCLSYRGLGGGGAAEVLTAGRAKKETPIKEKVAAIRRPSHVLGVLSP